MEALLDRIRGIAASSQKLARGLAAYGRLLSEPRNNVFSRKAELARLADDISAFAEPGLRGELEAWLAEERGRVAGDEEDFRFAFGTSLAAALKAAGLEARGQLPVLRVGMFTLRTDFGAGSATVFWGPEIERLKAGLRLVPESLAKTLRTWTDDLARRSLEPAELRALLLKAHARTCLLNGLEAGSRVALADLLADVVLLMQPKSFRADPSKTRFVEYPRVRFSYDLYRLKASGEGAGAKERLRLHVATFDATTRKTSALWVPDNENGEGTHYAYISVSQGG